MYRDLSSEAFPIVQFLAAWRGQKLLDPVEWSDGAAL
jgi:hypothetical protein